MKKFWLVWLFLLISAVSRGSSPSDGALIFEVQQAGSNSNAGCFKSGASGTDFTINAGKYNFTNLASTNGTNAAPVVTSASHNFVAADVGNCLRVTAGTSWTVGIYLIVSVSSNAATLDRAVGSAATLSSGTFFVGGALATLTQLNTDMCSGCRAYVKADATYTTAGLITLNYTNSVPGWIAGYTTTRGDNGKATIQASGSLSDRIINLAVGGNMWFRNFILDINSKASTTCMVLNANFVSAQNIECIGASSSNSLITYNAAVNRCLQCYVHGGSLNSGQPAFNLADRSECVFCTVSITSNGAVGFTMSGAYDACRFCVVDSLTGTTTDAFQVSNQVSSLIDHCVVYNITRDAVRIINLSSNVLISNCIFSTVLNGINNASGTSFRDGDIYNDYNFTFNASGAVVTGIVAGSHSATLTVDPFVLASSHQFGLNNKRGGGFVVRASGSPSTLPGVTGTFYPDGGAAQHQDPKFGR